MHTRYAVDGGGGTPNWKTPVPPGVVAVCVAVGVSGVRPCDGTSVPGVKGEVGEADDWLSGDPGKGGESVDVWNNIYTQVVFSHKLSYNMVPPNNQHINVFKSETIPTTSQKVWKIPYILSKKNQKLKF